MQDLKPPAPSCLPVTTAAAAAPQQQLARPPKEPRYIGDYVIEASRIGDGGLGIVYPAQHLPTGRTVAMKIGSNVSPREGQQ